MRFSLVDRITDLKPHKSITAIKNLTLAEEYLQDHFPGFPIMPGVLMVESLVQTSAWLMRHSLDFRYSTILLKEAKAVKFNSFVAPGKTLEVVSKLHRANEAQWSFKATGTVAGKSVVSARLTLEQFNTGELNPALKEMDRQQTEKMRELFAVLWTPHQL